MTPQEIELEIQARVEFKINEFRTALKNVVHFKWQVAHAEMTYESQYIWQAFEQIQQLLDKEVSMPLPIGIEHNTMLQQSRWKAKEEAVKEMGKYLEELRQDYFRGRSYNIHKIVSIIEKGQNYL